MIEAFEAFVERVRRLPTAVQYLVAFVLLFTLCSCCWLVILLTIPISEEQMEAPDPAGVHLARLSERAAPARTGSAPTPSPPIPAEEPGQPPAPPAPAGQRQPGAPRIGGPDLVQNGH